MTFKVASPDLLTALKCSDFKNEIIKGP